MRRPLLALVVLSVAVFPVLLTACSKKNDDMPPPPPSVGATATPTTAPPPAVPPVGADVPVGATTGTSTARHGGGGPGQPVTLTVPSAYASSMPSGMPSSITLPPGLKLPQGVQLPPGFPGAPVK